MTDAELLEQAAAWRAQGLEVALATVVSTWGSSPRPEGSHLVVNGRGELAGSVSGGCVEGAVVTGALAVLAAGRPTRLDFGVTEETALSVGLACGGTIAVWVEPLLPERALAALRAALAAKRPAVVAIDLGGAGSRLVELDGDGEGGALREAARAALAADRSGVWEGPEGPAFLRVYAPPVRLVIVGADHVAQALCALARPLGFEVVVVDPRTAFATEARFPGAELRRAWPDEALAGVGLDRRTAVVTLSHDPKLDEPALAAALRSEAFYVGALGSRKTLPARRERLRAAGVGAPGLERLRAPVGLAIGARTAAEIALSILAEVVAVRRGAQTTA
ncbi:MAG: XdhC family protein [Anaeromyxobacteraceae bacterium]